MTGASHVAGWVLVAAAVAAPGPAAARSQSAATHRLTVTVSLASGAGASGIGTVVSAAPALSCPSRCSADVAPGTSVRLRARAERGYRFAGWNDAGACAEEAATPATCTVTVGADDVTVSALFRPKTYNLHLVPGGDSMLTTETGLACAAGARATLASSCDAAFAPGYAVTIAADPDPGFRLVGWSVWECPGASRTCTVPMTTDRTVVALVDPVRLDVRRLGGGGTVTSVPAGIACGPECDEQQALFPQGTTVRLTATSGRDAFRRWSDPCGGPAPDCAMTLFTSMALSASFGFQAAAKPFVTGAPPGAPLTYQLDVSRAGRGGGVVFASGPGGRSPGIRCGGRCRAGGYLVSELVTVRAVTTRRSRLVGWRNGCRGRHRTCRLPVATHTSIRAVFAPRPRR